MHTEYLEELPSLTLEKYREEARQAHLANQERLQAKKEVMLNGDGKYDVSHFSAPGEMRECEHLFLRKMVLGGQPEYYCDDCETELHFPSPFARPKQHVAAIALQKLAFCMKYMGAEQVAMQLTRPHPRYDLEGAPELPPLEVIREQKAQWTETLRLLDEYETLALEGDSDASSEGPRLLGEGSQHGEE